jgi:hypothetical protein
MSEIAAMGGGGAASCVASVAADFSGDGRRDFGVLERRGHKLHTYVGLQFPDEWATFHLESREAGRGMYRLSVLPAGHYEARGDTFYRKLEPREVRELDAPVAGFEVLSEESPRRTAYFLDGHGWVWLRLLPAQ